MYCQEDSLPIPTTLKPQITKSPLYLMALYNLKDHAGKN